MKHHREQYGGKLPVGVVVVLDLGALQNLYLVSPANIRRDIAKALVCTDPQLKPD